MGATRQKFRREPASETRIVPENASHYSSPAAVSSLRQRHDDLARLLEEQDANTLGVNVVRVEDYPEIPGIIRTIRGGAGEKKRRGP